MASHLPMIGNDARLAQMVTEYLAQSGYLVAHLTSEQDGLDQLVRTDAPGLLDAVLLNLMLTDMDGLEVCRRIRAMQGNAARIPVWMPTAKGDPMNRIIGLKLGADGYLPEPFEPRELLARIRSILRRRPDGATSATNTPRFGALEIDHESSSVNLAGQACDLTCYQFDLMLALAERAGRVPSRDQIMEAVRGRELDAFDRSIDVQMGRIRTAVEIDPKNPSAFSLCAVWAICLPSSKTDGYTKPPGTATKSLHYCVTTATYTPPHGIHQPDSPPSALSYLAGRRGRCSRFDAGLRLGLALHRCAKHPAVAALRADCAQSTRRGAGHRHRHRHPA